MCVLTSVILSALLVVRIGGNELRNVVVVAENEEAGRLLNYLLAYNKLAGLTRQPQVEYNEADVAPVYVVPSIEENSLKAKIT